MLFLSSSLNSKCWAQFWLQLRAYCWPSNVLTLDYVCVCTYLYIYAYKIYECVDSESQKNNYILNWVYWFEEFNFCKEQLFLLYLIVWWHHYWCCGPSYTPSFCRLGGIKLNFQRREKQKITEYHVKRSGSWVTFPIEKGWLKKYCVFWC